MKISYAYFGSEPAFSTASELRDALLASYPGVEFFGSPVAALPQGRDYDTAPAWGWLGQLLRTRTDWWPAAGIALQHAAQDGGERARIALADLLVSCEESAVLVEWTEPLAHQWPDVRTSGARGYAWRDDQLGAIVARQRAQWTERQGPKISLWGAGGEAVVADVNTAADLERLLAMSARTGSKQPWSWLRTALLFHPWMRPVMPEVCAKLAAGTDLEVRAVLDWFAEEHDLWRYRELLAAWSRTPPAWWNDAVKVSRGRRNPLRWELAPEAKTLGEVALRARGCASRQLATPPIIDAIAPREQAPISPALVNAVAPRERAPAPSPPPVAPPPITLARASLNGDGFKPPTPALTFAEHHAAIVRLLVLDRKRVVSVDRDRVALLWNPRTRAVTTRHELPEHAILPSVFATGSGLAYLAHEPGALVVHALDDHRVIARVATPGVSEALLALCTADLSRVLIANHGELTLVALVDGAVLARASVSSPYYEPNVLAMHDTGRAFLVRFFHVAMDMYPTEAQMQFDRSTLKELSRVPGEIEPLAPLSQFHAARVEIHGAIARLTVANHRPLPDLAAHELPICLTEWCVDEALLTADTGGTIHCWDLDLSDGFARLAEACARPAEP